MKTAVLFIMIGLAAAPAVLAQQTVSGTNPPPTAEKIDRAKKNFLLGLKSGNEGVIESTLRLIGQAKMHCPECGMEELQSLVERLAAAGPSERIRYKAYLTAALCSDVEWFSGDPKIMAVPSDQFFSAVAERFNMKFFGMNGM